MPVSAVKQRRANEPRLKRAKLRILYSLIGYNSHRNPAGTASVAWIERNAKSGRIRHPVFHHITSLAVRGEVWDSRRRYASRDSSTPCMEMRDHAAVRSRNAI
jgi:hypothetical protein